MTDEERIKEWRDWHLQAAHRADQYRELFLSESDRADKAETAIERIRHYLKTAGPIYDTVVLDRIIEHGSTE